MKFYGLWYQVKPWHHRDIGPKEENLVDGFWGLIVIVHLL
jgi:hypothetical protein